MATRPMSRVVLSCRQDKVVNRDDVHQGTPPINEHTVVRPPTGLRVLGKLWLGALRYSVGQLVFRGIVAEVLTAARFETLAIVPNTYHHPQRDIDTVM